MQCFWQQQTSHFASLASNTGSTDRMYIKFDTGHYERNGETAPLYQLSSLEDLTNIVDCGVTKGEESVEDIYCILDLNEADIGVSQAGIEGSEGGIPLELNVPTEMCEYTQWMIPWHWNQRSGVGPRQVHECTDAPPGDKESTVYLSPTGNDDSWREQKEDSLSLCDPKANIVFPNNEKYHYDRSSVDGFANCCFGEALKYTRKCPEGSSGPDCCNTATIMTVVIQILEMKKKSGVEMRKNVLVVLSELLIGILILILLV